jgi:hypothetical protein
MDTREARRNSQGWKAREDSIKRDGADHHGRYAPRLSHETTNRKGNPVSAPKKPVGPVQTILDLLDGVRRSGNGWSALCPAHDDTNPSLSVTEADGGTVLLKCFAGCSVSDIVDALGIDMQDLFARDPAKPAREKSKDAGVTLEGYAEAKGFPVKFLQKLGVGQVYLQGTPAIRIPYMDALGNIPCTRLRLSMSGDRRFVFKTGSKPFLYGAWRLQENRSKYVCLVEGESDAQTLWLHRFSALGLPGAASWQEDWADYLDKFRRVYVVVEPDSGGEAVRRWIANSRIRDRARLVTISGAKDPSELYLLDPEQFAESWKRMMEDAIPWSDADAEEKRSARRAAWKKCETLARQPDILSLFADAVEKRGVAREARAAKLLYLALTSRVLKRPISAVVTGPSAGGKSFIVERTLEFFPPSAFYDLTAMSERALIYSTEPLSHRFLVLYEGAAL